MEKILDLAEIKISLTNKKSPLAKVTLNWNNEFEVRFFRIVRRPNGTLWFQPPALKESGWAKCFGVIKKEDWHRLEDRVIKKLFECLEEESIYDKEFIDELKKTNKEEKINIDEIPDSFT